MSGTLRGEIWGLNFAVAHSALLSTMSNSLMRSAINEWWPKNKLGEKSDIRNKVSILFMFIYGFTRREFANSN